MQVRELRQAIHDSFGYARRDSGRPILDHARRGFAVIAIEALGQLGAGRAGS